MIDHSFVLEDIFEPAQLAELIAIWDNPQNTTEDICEKMVEPNIDQINKKLAATTGRQGDDAENDPRYIAYCCEYVLSKTHPKIVKR